jgi:Protein of unknown function (DUF2505)
MSVGRQIGRATVRLSAEIRYPADPSVVFRMMVDPAFQEAKCTATGSVEHEVDVDEHEDGGATIISRRSMPTDQVPDVFRTFLGSAVRLHETQEWQPVAADGTRTGSIVVTIEGIPVRFTGTMVLAADGTGSHEHIDGQLKASVPLIGGRIERAAEPAVLAAIRVEQRTGTAWLAQRA